MEGGGGGWRGATRRNVLVTLLFIFVMQEWRNLPSGQLNGFIAEKVEMKGKKEEERSEENPI